MIGRLSDIDLRLLRVFVSVVDAGGFSLATAKLNVAESTISQCMTDLEKRLGMRLCDRGRSGFRLTPNGEQIYKLTADLLMNVEHYRDQVAFVRSDLSGTLRLGLPDAIITYEENSIVPALSLYMERHPELKVDIEMLTPRDLERAVFEGKLHLAVAPEHRRLASLRFIRLFSERNSLYCGAEHALFAIPDVQIDNELLGQSSRIARGYLDRFDEQFFSEPLYRATVHQIEAAALLILTGQCIGFLPNHFAERWVQRRQMRAIKPARLSFASTFGVILKPDAQEDPRVEHLVTLLRDTFGAQEEAGPRASRG